MTKKRARRSGRRPARRPLRRLNRGPILLALVTIGAVVGVGALIVLGIATQGGGNVERIEEISAAGRSRGTATAPVTIIEFADYQCPYCKRFAETTERQIEREYVATDQVRLEFRNMALIGRESVVAAVAAECANEQGRFWEYRDLLFEKQRGENSGSFTATRLSLYAGELGLDREAFNTCLESGRHEQLVLDETEAGKDAGVDSTPCFLINGELVRGAQPFEEFARIIERKLEEAKRSS